MDRARTRTRTPRQQRGIETRQRLVEAALALFAEEGYYNTDTKRIAARAGTAVGSFYAYFRDKKEVFLAALVEYDRRITAGTVDSPPTDPALMRDKERALESYIRRILAAHRYYPAFHREATLLGETDPEVGRIMAAQDKRAAAAAYQYLSMWRDHVAVADLESASFLIFSAIESTVHAIAFGRSELDGDRLIGELTTMILRYLFPGETRANPSRPPAGAGPRPAWPSPPR
ncbi:MAG: TetR/AcrR family transcriptional regulator [Bacteroidota bacterium]